MTDRNADPVETNGGEGNSTIFDFASGNAGEPGDAMANMEALLLMQAPADPAEVNPALADAADVLNAITSEVAVDSMVDYFTGAGDAPGELGMHTVDSGALAAFLNSEMGTQTAGLTGMPALHDDMAAVLDTAAQA